MATHHTLSETIYKKIKRKIIKGQYKPGSELTESALAESFNVSRTPIREALRKLEQEMLVRITPHKGALVIKPTLNDIVEINNLREVLEGLAARLAVKWATDDEIEELIAKFPKAEGKLDKEQYDVAYQAGTILHDFIVKNSNNKRLQEIICNIQGQVELVMQINANIPGRYDEAYKEHMKILQAIKNRDEDGAEAAMREHIQEVLKSLIDYNL